MATITIDNFWNGEYDDSDIKNRSEFFRDLDPAKVKDLVDKLSEHDNKEVKLRIIANMLFVYDYKTKKNEFNVNVKELMRQLRLNNQIEDFLIGFEKTAGDITSKVEAFKKNTESAAKTEIFKTILTSLTEMKYVSKIITTYEKILSKEELLSIFNSFNIKDAVERLLAREIINSTTGNTIINIIKESITKKGDITNVHFIEPIIALGKDLNKDLITELFTGIEEDKINNIFENIVSYAATSDKIRSYISKLPDSVKAKYIDYLAKEKKLDFASMSIEEKAEVIEFANKDTREKLVETLSDTDKDDIASHMKGNVNDLKYVFEKSKKRINIIKDEIDNIQKGKDGKPGLAKELKNTKKDIKNLKRKIKKIKKRIAKDEKRLIIMAGFPKELDRIGFIENIHLRQFISAQQKYETDSDELKKAEKDLAAAETSVKKQNEVLERAKERVKAQKEQLQKEIGAYSFRRVKIKDPEKIKELLGRSLSEKNDKIGKFDDEKKIQQAWAYIVSEHQKSGMNYTDENVRIILTSSQEGLGLDKKQLESLIVHIQKELERKRAAITEDPELEASIEESAGMRMGMSNYLVIIAVTALTIMGLIAILTLILS